MAKIIFERILFTAMPCMSIITRFNTCLKIAYRKNNLDYEGQYLGLYANQL